MTVTEVYFLLENLKLANKLLLKTIRGKVEHLCKRMKLDTSQIIIKKKIHLLSNINNFRFTLINTIMWVLKKGDQSCYTWDCDIALISPGIRHCWNASSSQHLSESDLIIFSSSRWQLVRQHLHRLMKQVWKMLQGDTLLCNTSVLFGKHAPFKVTAYFCYYGDIQIFVCYNLHKL